MSKISPYYRIPRGLMDAIDNGSERLNVYLGARNGVDIEIQKSGEIMEIVFTHKGNRVWTLRMEATQRDSS